MRDYVYPSIYFSYFFFALGTALAAYFFIKSIKDGYWGKDSEEAKHRMMQD
jgi:hypothetical protein